MFLSLSSRSFYFPCVFFLPFIYGKTPVNPKTGDYNACRFTRDEETCDYKKFDSFDGEGPCIIARKAGLTRLDGVKVNLLNTK